MRSKLVACGMYLPEKRLSNDYFAEILDTSDEWIKSRTGILYRHIAADDEMTSDLATSALKSACDKHNIDPNSIDGIIVATTTPDKIFPAVATTVQAKLGISSTCCMALDVNAVCTGFIYALAVADSFIKSGVAKRIAVIGAETMSRIVDWEDRSTVVLFGDGAGAFILEAADEDEKDVGFQNFELHADGSLNEILHVPGGPSSRNLDAKLAMNGREVFKVAVTNGSKVTKSVMEKSGWSAADLDYFIMHQANMRILDAVADKLSFDHDKVIRTISDHANTSAASIPLAFCETFNSSIPKGKSMIFTGFGGGMTWGSVCLRV